LGIDEIPDGYEADSVWSYEVGAKSRLFDGKVQLNTSAFYIDWTNIQQNLRLPTCRSTLILNVGQAVSKGFDAALTAQVTDALRLEATVAYTNAEYTDSIITENLTTGATTDVVLEGDALSTIAPWVVTLSAQYDFEIKDTTSFVRVDYDYRGAAPEPLIGRAGVDPLAHRRPETHFVSARAGVELDSLKVSVFVDNLFNSTPILTRTRHSARDAITLFYSSTMKPRTFGVTASFRY